jgi:hypothetical protein
MLEECESGRIGTIGNRVKGNLPWVQIPPPPPGGLYESRGREMTKLRRIDVKAAKGWVCALGRGRQTHGPARQQRSRIGNAYQKTTGT